MIGRDIHVLHKTRSKLTAKNGIFDTFNFCLFNSTRSRKTSADEDYLGGVVNYKTIGYNLELLDVEREGPVYGLYIGLMRKSS